MRFWLGARKNVLNLDSALPEASTQLLDMEMSVKLKSGVLLDSVQMLKAGLSSLTLQQ